MSRYLDRCSQFWRRIGFPFVCVIHIVSGPFTFAQTSGSEKVGVMTRTMGIVRSEGALALYNGLSASLVRQLTYSTTRFAIYEVNVYLYTHACTRAGCPAPISFLVLVCHKYRIFSVVQATSLSERRANRVPDARGHGCRGRVPRRIHRDAWRHGQRQDAE
jgi:hypothetical protein